MGALPSGDYSPSAHHHSLLQEVLGNRLPSESLVRSYKRSFNGFAAKLTDQERQKIASMEGVVSVFPSTTYELHTTRSWDFIGFKENVKRVPKVESDVIVGVIDSGIWPEAESFNDDGFGPPPKKWRGACEGGKNFTCNKKIVGARFYGHEYVWERTARDQSGHGTLTASIAAGNQVNNVSLFGLAPGNARGGVPSARIAIYNACAGEKCQASEILAAFDDAISDGVDILSVSLGPGSRIDTFFEAIGIGSFHAMKKGILTSQAAGNSGPDSYTMGSVAPWTMTVAATTTDRLIITKVILGDNTTLVGKANNDYDFKGEKFPLIDGGHLVWGGCHDSSGGSIIQGSAVDGKIVFYEGFSQGVPLLKTKAVGMILQDTGPNEYSWNYLLAASKLNCSDGERVRSYIKNTKNPFASILRSETLKDDNAPMVASFSSRGPNQAAKDILKPDITAPGVDILAAWLPELPVTEYTADPRFSKFNIAAGTSLSCPHATGAAAYVKSFHPDWSPAAIKSALMTTALPLNATRNVDAEFAYGAGQIDPVRATNPGLVYDAVEGDYVKMLCSIGFTTKKIRLISGDNSSCPENYNGTAKDLNYPSMVSDAAEAKFTRTVTNVGVANSNYTATISSPSNLKISVIPNILSFKSLYEKQSFVVTVSAATVKNGIVYSASLIWSDGVHVVRSPIVVLLGNL